MIISSRRKRIGAVLGVLLLAGLGLFFWPFIAGPGQMQNFCSSLAVGASVAQVRAQSAQHGYRVSSPIEGQVFVHDPKSYGRFTCNVEFGPDGLVSAIYSFND